MDQLGAGPIEMVPVTRATLIESARLRAGTALRLPDAIRAAAALAEDSATFLTTDPQFRTVRALPVVLLSDLG